MKIQTIHAFCQSLLGRFPLEADVPPHFQVLDERTAAEMLESARIEVLAAGLEAENSKLAEAVSEISAHRHEQAFSQVMNELIRERGRLERMIVRQGGVEAVVDTVFIRRRDGYVSSALGAFLASVAEQAAGRDRAA